MEQIKDMVTLRAFALHNAIGTYYGQYPQQRFKDMVLERAKYIESYILGEATLPEVYDADAPLKEWREVFKENISRPSFSMSWISSDTVKPKENQQVLVMCKDRKYPLFGEYIGEDYWEVSDADNILQSKFDEVTVVAWLPIPEYNGNTL